MAQVLQGKRRPSYEKPNIRKIELVKVGQWSELLAGRIAYNENYITRRIEKVVKDMRVSNCRELPLSLFGRLKKLSNGSRL